MDFLGAHRANFLNQISVPSWRNIPRGSLVYCQYRKEKGLAQKLYLILDVKSFGREQLIHVLDLKYVNPSILEGRLMKHTIQKMPLQETFRGKVYTILEFKKGEMTFYKSTIKPLINDGFSHSYRTIDPTKMSSIKLVAYEWKEGKKKEEQGITKKQFEAQKK